MDSEYTNLKAVAGTKEFQSIMSVLFARWSADSFAYTADILMEQFGLECNEVSFRTIVVYPHNTRRTRPAFVAINSMGSPKFDFTSAINTGAFIIEVVEAGKYGVAGPSEKSEIRSTAKG